MRWKTLRIRRKLHQIAAFLRTPHQSALRPTASPQGEAQAVEIDLRDAEPYRKQIVDSLEAGRTYLGQMDLNIRSPKVWEYYENTLQTLADYGARIVRLDAFAYAPKEPGARNFFNEPGTWDLLERVRGLADGCGLTLLPEIHASYAEKPMSWFRPRGIWSMISSCRVC